MDPGRCGNASEPVSPRECTEAGSPPRPEPTAWQLLRRVYAPDGRRMRLDLRRPRLPPRRNHGRPWAYLPCRPSDTELNPTVFRPVRVLLLLTSARPLAARPGETT